MNVWICIAYDPLPGIDHTTRLLRYGTLAEQLCLQGHAVVLWTSTFDHYRKTQRFAGDRSIRIDQNLTIELIHCNGYSRNISLARVRHNRLLARRFLVRAAKAPKPDVIFAGIPCLEFSSAAAMFATSRAIPFNVDVQDIWPEVYVSAFPRPLRWFGRLLLRNEFQRTREMFWKADGLTAVSSQYMEWAQRICHSPGRNDQVFPLGYRLPIESVLDAAKANATALMAQWRLPADRTLVTFLGQFGASYDIEAVVDAARILERDGVAVHFALAGAGDKFSQAQKRARGLRSVTLPGWLEYVNTISLLQMSNIGLATYSRRAPQSLPYKPFEYMAFGLPIVSSLPGELNHLIEHYCLGENYRAGDACSLAEAIRHLISNPNRRINAGRAARELFNREYEATAITRRMIAHLETLVA